MRNISNDYLNQFENDKPSEDCLVILQGRNGYDDNVCHLSMKDNYEILPSTTIAELLGMGNLIYGDEALPYYHIEAYVDLKKFKLNPIKPYEKNTDIVPYKNYIIRRGKANFTVANSCNGGGDGGYFVDKYVNAYLPFLTNNQVDTIFAKHREIKRKLEEINKDFEK
ncbi:MAG: hypothetical protein J6T74_02160 [Clostridia bacterium]|nr:hypothetical protein [Clostridia bacterium]